jgi:hypothetical protein
MQRGIAIHGGIACCLVAALCLCSHAQDKKKKQPDVQVLESSGRREEGKIKLDGRVRVTAEKPLRGLVVVFDFLSPERAVISSEKTIIDEEPMNKGQEGSYHVETLDLARAVYYKIRAFDRNDRELRVENEGPFTIE